MITFRLCCAPLVNSLDVYLKFDAKADLTGNKELHNVSLGMKEKSA